ncbi:deoxyribodipyrimidine photo-lyase [Actinomycetospora sp. NBRC 106375]|uniref:cryptochrome/photolyase family protein n=1 Tax=Actinomycetospora sp. NBRC 106375 TaxID=3032207 RepID=UPI0024A10920|nr:deoxyribodipyrimidine photo-lyase [Actinomycetospora sp. NBRC 106375]GLZ50003.1 deoxyribodipyrimidine photo-lyase [Actinomycetospora sp. NBRC 106375]
MPTICLFTRDLRVHDQPVLRGAAEGAEDGQVVPLFVVDDAMRGFRVPNRARFLAESLADLDAGLRAAGARLVVRWGDVVEEVRTLAGEVGASAVHVAGDVSAYAGRRRKALEKALGDDDRELVVHDAVVTVVSPGTVTPTSGDHFKIFTPYHRKWADVETREPLDPPTDLTLPTKVRAGSVPEAEDLADGDTAPGLMPGGEGAARERLQDWLDHIDDYAEGQDLPARDATSRLSPYLHFGCVSPTEIARRAGTSSEAAAQFVRQLAWRDFHHQTLAAVPRASAEDYRDRGDRWRRDDEEFAAWAEGRTGVPIVDAGMRQLHHEGWMHNRLRLITGSFLAKSLYLDWRLGARHFLDHLVDGDVANNQMNWQWVAGTGTDTRPNRVLNPITQAKRYDPDGEYVRHWVPELAELEGARIHEPWKQSGEFDYPAPVVDLDEAGSAFRAARGA